MERGDMENLRLGGSIIKNNSLLIVPLSQKRTVDANQNHPAEREEISSNKWTKKRSIQEVEMIPTE